MTGISQTELQENTARNVILLMELTQRIALFHQHQEFQRAVPTDPYTNHPRDIALPCYKRSKLSRIGMMDMWKIVKETWHMKQELGLKKLSEVRNIICWKNTSRSSKLENETKLQVQVNHFERA